MSYVAEVRDATRSFARDLLAENERLRVALATHQASDSRVLELEAATRTLEEENRELRQRVTSLEHERVARSGAASRERPSDGRGAVERQLIERFVELEEMNSQLANLYTGTYRLHLARNRTEVLLALQALITDLTGSEEMAFFEMEPDGRGLRLIGSRGALVARTDRVALGTGPIGRAAASGSSVMARDAAGRGTMACVPLHAGGRLIGVMGIGRLSDGKDPLPSRRRELLEMVAAHAALALYRTQP
ncbi:MAG: GAF domain-containing protein [Candidatus Eisenbacteria bacterium]|nr:GAF domain-containing protein [Candidatus Eisenbacteria bacterium]